MGDSSADVAQAQHLAFWCRLRTAAAKHMLVAIKKLSWVAIEIEN
jgi:hypothetical protein